MRVFSFAVIAGFPLAAILAWAFDLTPQGIKPASATQASDTAARPAGQRFSHVLQGLILLAVGFLVADRFLLERQVTAVASSVTASGSVTRFTEPLPQDQGWGSTSRQLVEIARDGSRYVYLTTDGLYLRSIDQFEAQLIAGTDPNPTSPTFSLDGQSLAYFERTQRQLRRIAIGGGAAVVIAEDVGNPLGISWEADGTILFSQNDGGIYRVSATGGVPELIVPSDEGMQTYGPRLLPDGDTILFSIGPPGNWDEADVVAQVISTGKRTVLIRGGSDARYLRSGHLIYALGDNLFAISFDAESLTSSGGAVPVVQGVARAIFTATANYSVSDRGTLVYLEGTDTETQALILLSRDGGREPLTIEAPTYLQPRFSPDGTRIAYTGRGPNSDIWTYDLARHVPTRLTFEAGIDSEPIWTPDGQGIVFWSDREGGGLFLQSADGTGQAERLTEARADGTHIPASFMPDGSELIYYTNEPGGRSDVYAVSMSENHTETLLLGTEFDEDFADLSPDGRWLTYVSDESGRDQIYVRPYPNVNDGKWQISINGGTEPLWRSAGREIFFRLGDAVMVATVEFDPEPSVLGLPQELFTSDLAATSVLGRRNYDVSTDGQLFLIKNRIAATEGRIARIRVVQNWFEELERLVPTE